MAVGIGADVCIIDKDLDRLRQIDAAYGNRVRTYYSDPLSIEREVCAADAVIGAVLLPGGTAPKLVSASMVDTIKAFETSQNQATLQEMSNLKAGQKVKLKHVALGSLEGLVQSVSSKRVAVLLEILGRPTVVQLDHHQVEVTN
jgi:transcription antitermination factor NusG